MGIVRMGIPEDISLFIKDANKINHFVETGTFNGETTLWASRHFKEVDTIEFSEKIYYQTKEKFKAIGNINFILGDSRKALREIVSNASESILFWLDAHWCSGDSYGEEDQCPLIDELKIINSSSMDHFILIDDARLFMAPPPLPNLVKFYPGITEIIDELKEQFVMSFEDVLFILPQNFKKEFSIFMQNKTTIAWKNYGQGLKEKELINNRTRFAKTKALLNDILAIWNLK
jgi:hypothetical protein